MSAKAWESEPEFEALIKNERTVLKLVARLAYYLGYEPKLDEAEVSRVEHAHILAIVRRQQERAAGKPSLDVRLNWAMQSG